MAAPSTHQLLLLADHLKLSLLERQRAINLKLPAHKQDGQITRGLSNLREGIEHLETVQSDLGQAEDSNSDLAKLRRQFGELYAQFYNTEPPSPEVQRPNDQSLAGDFAAAQSQPRSTSKNVRFRDDPNAEEDDPEAAANRAALFSDQERYRDDPEAPDQAQMDNQQIHEYHTQVLRQQDEQLDTLSQSIGRQRILGIQMGDEMDEQNEMLVDVERGVDRHMDTLGRARRNLGNIARKSKDNWNWLTIGILIVILVLLIAILK